MNDVELLSAISDIIKRDLSDTLTEMGFGNRANNNQSAFKKTEQLLWNYTRFHELIKNKEEQIQEVLDCGLRTKSKDICEYHCGGGTVQGITTVQDTVQEVVDAIQYDILWVRQCLERLELALDIVRKDPDYPIVEDYYFHGVTLNDLAVEYETTMPTIARRKNALVRQIALHLFPQDAISEMLN